MAAGDQQGKGDLVDDDVEGLLGQRADQGHLVTDQIKCQDGDPGWQRRVTEVAATTGSPVASLRAARRASLLEALSIGAVAAATFAILPAIGLAVMGYGLAARICEDVLRLRRRWYRIALCGLIGLWTGLLLSWPLGASAIACLTAGVVLYQVLNSPWGMFELARAYAFLNRWTPYRLFTFLEDAYARGILRRVGSGYAFRHRLLELQIARTHYVPTAQYAMPVRADPFEDVDF